jgi:exosortase C (VPDSG-CTERM-specific)
MKGICKSAPARRVAYFGVYVILLAIFFAERLIDLARYSFNHELYSHIILVPIVSVYLANQKRKLLSENSPSSPRIAAALVIAAITLAFSRDLGFARGSHDHYATFAASFVLLIAAGGFQFLGRAWMRSLIFPFGLLVFFIPFPEIALDSLENFLMRTSAALADTLFQWAGTPVYRSGQLLELPGITLEVARECSGIRSSLVLFITSVIASHLFLSNTWHRIALVALVLPLAILRNAIRVWVIGQLCVYVGPQMIDTWVHHQGGPLFFALSLVPLFLAAAWLRNLEVALTHPEKFPEPNLSKLNPKPYESAIDETH